MIVKQRAKALEYFAYFMVFLSFVNLHIKCIVGEEEVKAKVENCLHIEEEITYLDNAVRKKRTCSESIRSSESYERQMDSWSFSLGIEVGIDVKMVGANWGLTPSYDETTETEKKDTQYQKDKKCKETVWSDKVRQIYRVTERRVIFTMNGKKEGTKSVSLGRFRREEYVMSINVDCPLDQQNLYDMAVNHLELHYKHLNGTIDKNRWISTDDCGTDSKTFLEIALCDVRSNSEETSEALYPINDIMFSF